MQTWHFTGSTVALRRKTPPAYAKSTGALLNAARTARTRETCQGSLLAAASWAWNACSSPCSGAALRSSQCYTSRDFSTICSPLCAWEGMYPVTTLPAYIILNISTLRAYCYTPRRPLLYNLCLRAISATTRSPQTTHDCGTLHKLRRCNARAIWRRNATSATNAYGVEQQRMTFHCCVFTRHQ